MLVTTVEFTVVKELRGDEDGEIKELLRRFRPIVKSFRHKNLPGIPRLEFVHIKTIIYPQVLALEPVFFARRIPRRLSNLPER